MWDCYAVEASCPQTLQSPWRGNQDAGDRNAYNAVLESHLDRLNNRRGFFPIRFGYQAETDPEAILDANAQQVRNIPKAVAAIVIPIGSGVSAQGILKGIRRHRPMTKVYLIQPFGYDRRIAIPDGITAGYFTGKYDYARPLEITVDDFQLDEIYEAKSFDYMKRRLKRMLAAEQVCFWVIGNANDMRHSVLKQLS